MDNPQQRGDYLEKLCQAWALARRPGSTLIGTKINAIHGIDFAVETGDGDVYVYEVKSATGGLSDGQFTIDWIKARIGPALKAAIVRAVLRRRYIIRAMIRVADKPGAEPKFSFGSATGKLLWSQLFPGLPLPVLEIAHRQATVSTGQVTVTHQSRGHGLSQTDIYRLPTALLSCNLLESIVEHANYPSIVPHSHEIFENGVCRYSRSLAEWDAHQIATEDRDPYSGSVRKYVCKACRKSCFGFAGEQNCNGCHGGVEADAIRKKEALIRSARDIGASPMHAAQWKESADHVHALLAQWKTLERAGQREDDLWLQFQAARQRFFDARQQYFDEQSAARTSHATAKEKLIASAKNLAQPSGGRAARDSNAWKTAGDAMQVLLDQWKNVGNAGREAEEGLWNRFNAARQDFFDAKANYYQQQDEARARRKTQKEQLIAAAERLAHSVEWKEAGDGMQNLMVSWQAIGNAGHDEDGLWARFQAARQGFFDRRGRYFDEQDRLRALNKGKKERLISAARALSHSTEWRDAGEAMRKMMDDWKAIGPAGKDDNEGLWEEFTSARQTFFDRRTAHFDKMESEHARNRTAKQGLIRDAERYSSSSDWKGASAQLRALMDQWRQIGSAGRDHEDELWQRFSAARQVFYDSQERHFASGKR